MPKQPKKTRNANAQLTFGKAYDRIQAITDTLDGRAIAAAEKVRESDYAKIRKLLERVPTAEERMRLCENLGLPLTLGGEGEPTMADEDVEVET